MAVMAATVTTMARPHRSTDAGSHLDESGSSSSGSGGSGRGTNMFRRMSAQAMGLEANALCHRSHWVPKSTRSSCSNCRRTFRLWTTKHHCRFCGEVVCRTCSTQRILIQRKTLRSCDACVSVNVQSISELSRRNSLNDLEARSSRASMIGSGIAGRKSDGALLHKSLSLPQSHQQQQQQYHHHHQQMRLRRHRSSLSKREGSVTVSTLRTLRRRYRSQLPYVVVVFLLTIAGVTNLLTRRA